MQQQSRIVISNQQGPHPDLKEVVLKHIENRYQKPISTHSLNAFKIADEYYQKHSGHFILDSACGVGESTYHLALANPESFVLGIDQSQKRLLTQNFKCPPNALLLRTDCIDFWRLAFKAGWQLQHHYLLYPNPWPKKKHFQRRWHGHPIFPVLQKLGGQLELRTNWRIYAEEFTLALKLLNVDCSDVEKWHADPCITPFERKYQLSQQLYSVKAIMK